MITVDYTLKRTVTDSVNFNISAMQNRLEQIGYTVSVSRPLFGIGNELTIRFSGFPNYFQTTFADRNDYYNQAVLDTDTALIFARDGGFSGNTNNANTSNGATYTVVSGDTLSKIGNKLKINWQTIANLNNIRSPYTISIGQVLQLPNGASVPTNNTNTNANNVPLIQAQQIPQILANNNVQPQPPKKSPFDAFFDSTQGKLTSVGIAALILIGGIVLTQKK